MERFLLLLSSIISLFVLSWSLGRSLGPQNCINSSVVSKVIIESDGTALRSCDVLARLMDPEPHSLIHQTNLFQRLERLDRAAPYLLNSAEKITIVISKSEPRSLDISESVLRIGTDQIRDHGVLERALLVSRLNSGYSLATAVAADFLWSHFLNFNVEVGDYKSRPKNNWLSELKSLSLYCRSKDKLLIHHNFCEAHNDVEDSFISSSDQEPVHWSLVSVLTEALGLIYREASLSEKQRILESLIFLGDFDSLWIEEVARGTQIQELDTAFIENFEKWLSPVALENGVLHRALEERSVKSKARTYNYVVIGRSSRDVFPIYELADEIKNSQEPLILQFGREKYFYPSDVYFKFSKESILNHIQIQNLIYVSCEMPEVESLLEYERYTNKVVFVRQCESEDINWSLVSQNGLLPYLAEHANTEFIEFNLSALKLAKKVRGPLRDSGNFMSWQKWLLWSRSVDDGGLEVKRPLSAIDGVQRYRIF